MKNIVAKKRFGQNFLKDSSVLDKIIQAMPKNDNHIVEIGPGLGDLTQKMLKYKSVTAYEIDGDLLSILRTKFAMQLEAKSFELVHTDALKVWEMQGTLYKTKFDLIANLPYYVATHMILKALEDDNCETIIVMIQKEVAEKFEAKSGEKEFSSLGVIAQLCSHKVEILFDVPPSSFEPAPKVDSSVLCIKKDMTKKLDDGFKSFLKVAFSQPRKKLSKNLSSFISKSLCEQIFNELNIDDQIRPHELEALLYHQMYQKVIKNDRNNTTRE